MVEPDKPKRRRMQFRRAISVRRAVYERLKDYCQKYDLPLSAVVEHVIKKAIP